MRVFLWGEKMPLPTAAELTDPNATNTQMKQRLGQLADGVESKESVNLKFGQLNRYLNLLRKSLAEFNEYPISTNGYVTFKKVSNGLQVNCAPTTGVINAIWRGYAEDFKSGVIFALVRMSADSGSGGTLSLKQYDSNYTQVATVNIATNLSAAISNQTYQINNITLNSNAKYVEIQLDLGDSVNKVRKAYVHEISLTQDAIASGKAVFSDFSPKINIFPNPALSKAMASIYEASAANEVLSFDGAAILQATYDLNVSDLVAVGSYVTFEADVFCDAAGKADITLQCFNNAGTQLNSNIIVANTIVNIWERLVARVILPTNTAYIRFRFVKRTGTNSAQFKNVIATSTESIKGVVINAFNPSSGGGESKKTVYLSKTGNDSNNGASLTKPVATITTALNLAKPRGKIIISEGDYEFDSNGYSWAGFDELEITAVRNNRVRFISGTKVTDISKTPGYTKVYQGTLLGTGWNPPKGNFIWHHDVADPRTLINPSNRHPLQKGRSHRSQSTRIKKVASIAAIEAAADPAWYHDAANNTIYFSIWGGADAKNADIRIPSSRYSCFYGGTGTEQIKMRGINVLYCGNNGFGAQRLISFEADHCSSLFSSGDGNGAAFDDTLFVKTNYCEWGMNDWDGGNMHCYQTNTYQVPIIYQAFDTWSHDNGDDGDSMHEICVGTYYGGLYEFNGDRGIATAYGAHATAFGTVCQYNGQIDTEGGEGFAALGTLSTDTGVGTQFNCHYCVSIGNRYNYSSSEATSTLNAYESISRDATNTGFRAAGTSVINSYDCKTKNDATSKSGVVNIFNSDQLS